MRLLLISHCSNDPNGGTSRVFHLLTDGLRELGHEIQCLHLEDIEIPRGMSKLAIRGFLPEYVSRTAARVLERSNVPFDVVFSASGMLWPLYKQLQAKPKRPLLVHNLVGLSFFDHQSTMDEVARGHMTISPVYRFYTGALPLRWDIKGAVHSDLTIVQNRRDEDFLLEKGFGHMKWIPLSVHPKIAAAGANAPKQADRDPMSLLWFGSWIARKGTHYLPRAFERICERFPSARLTLGGTGASQQEIAAHFKPSLRENIRVLPRISIEDQISEFGKNAIFLFPSLSEGFGFAGLEALAMGMALVTTQTGFGGDLLVDRQHARVVPAASALHMADAAIELMESTDLRECMAEKGGKLARSMTAERMVKEYEAAIETALRARTQDASVTELAYR